jgi:bacillithiol biosynthesis cysteine-adding enzyme BshC
MWGGLVIQEYFKPLSPIHSFYEFLPFAEEEFSKRADQLSSHSRWNREALVNVLRAYLEPELKHPALLKQLERLKQPDSLVVITGQQAGLATGPLFTLYKAWTAILLAKREEERLQRPVIPVFWIAGEDHDLAEVDHLWLRTAEGKLVKSRFPFALKKKSSVSAIELDPEQIEVWRNELEQFLPDSENKRELLEKISQFLQPPVTLSRFFARIMHFLFAEYGLLLIDSADPGLRKLESSFFHTLIDQDRNISDALQATLAKWEQAGFHSPFAFEPNQSHLFIQIEGERKALYHTETGWRTRDGWFRFDSGALKEKAELLSNNVVTRPLMQEYVFPVLAYVAGPGEITYWGCLKDVFRQVGFTMPIVYPRLQFTLVERHVEKRVEQYGLSWEEAIDHPQRKKEEWFFGQHWFDYERLFQSLMEQVEELYRPVIAKLTEEVGIHAGEIGEKNRKKVLEQVEYLKRKTQTLVENRVHIAIKHWDEIILGLRPRDQLQERVYNLLHFWNLYGIDWVKDLGNTSLSQLEKKHGLYFL